MKSNEAIPTSFNASKSQQTVDKEMILERTAVGAYLLHNLGIIVILLVEAEDLIKILPWRHDRDGLPEYRS